MDGKGQATRKRILRAVRAEPGLTKSALTRRVGLAWGTVGHHLHRLARAQKVDIFRVGRSVHVVPRRVASEYGHNPALMPPLARQVLVTLAELAEGAGPTKLGRRAGATARRIQNQLDYLAQAGLIESDESYRPSFTLTRQGQEAAAKLRPTGRAEHGESEDGEAEHGFF